MKQILPIGSIIEAGGECLCVLGTRLADHEGIVALAYVVVKHPRGLAGQDSLGMILADQAERVVFRGNEGTGGKRYREGMERFYGQLIGRDVKAAEELMQLKNLKKAVEERAGRLDTVTEEMGG